MTDPNNVRRLLLAFVLFYAAGVSGQTADFKLKLEWDPVAEASGYRVELRDASGRMIVDRRTEATLLNVRLKPGRYAMRVTAFNAFGKPDSSTDWRPLNVRVQKPDPVQGKTSTKETTPAKKTPAPAPPASPKRTPRPTKDGGYNWTALVPGLPDFEGGRNGRAAAWAGSFAGSGALAGYYYLEALRVNDELEQDPLRQLLNEPAGALLISAGNTTTTQITPIFLLALQTEQENTTEFEAHGQRYLFFGIGALIVYGVHAALYANSSPPPKTAPAPAGGSFGFWLAPDPREKRSASMGFELRFSF